MRYSFFHLSAASLLCDQTVCLHHTGVRAWEQSSTQKRNLFSERKSSMESDDSMELWCDRRDLNPYPYRTRPSNVRVCQFRHDRALRFHNDSYYIGNTPYLSIWIFRFIKNSSPAISLAKEKVKPSAATIPSTYVPRPQSALIHSRFFPVPDAHKKGRQTLSAFPHSTPQPVGNEKAFHLHKLQQALNHPALPPRGPRQSTEEPAAKILPVQRSPWRRYRMGETLCAPFPSRLVHNIA